MRLWTVFANVLSDLKFPQTSDEPRSQQNCHEQSRNARHPGAERRVLKNAERRQRRVGTIQLLESQPVQHRSVGTPSRTGFSLSQKLLEREFDMDSAGTLEENRITGLGKGAHQASRSRRLIEKKRGVGRKAGTLGCIQH